MKQSTRNKLLLRTVRDLQNAETSTAKYNLASIAEDLIFEYKGLKAKAIALELDNLDDF